MCLDQLLEGGKGDFNDDPLEEDDEVRGADGNDEDLSADEGDDIEIMTDAGDLKTAKSEAVNKQGLDLRQPVLDFRIQKK